MESSIHIDQASSSKSHGGLKRTASTSMNQGPSSTFHCGQPRTGFPKWNPKHKIFLSHSGKQKEFVRQLCKDLERESHHPFFDERSSSLPMGEWFAPLIFGATRHCLVAVIVLSEDFLTSKWPMLELVEFVRAKKSHNPDLKLFPLFYKLSVENLKLDSNVRRWEAEWEKIIALSPNQLIPVDDSYTQLDLSSCREALRELRGANGLKLERFASELEYREAIVKEISLLVPPDLLDDTSDVIGNERLCKDVVDQVHTEHEGRKLLKDHMNQQPVFLVIDNIIDSSESSSQALAFLNVGFHLGSMIMITSRSLDVVGELFPSHANAMYCKPVTRLSEEEARLIFLRRATPQQKLETLTIEEHEILDKCLSECHFSFDHKGRQYHPLALQASADYYHKQDKVDMLKWKKHFGDPDKFRHSNAFPNIFGVLGLQFKTLTLKQKLIFLDLCLYAKPRFFREHTPKHLNMLFDIHDNEQAIVNDYVV